MYTENVMLLGDGEGGGVQLSSMARDLVRNAEMGGRCEKMCEVGTCPETVRPSAAESLAARDFKNLRVGLCFSSTTTAFYSNHRQLDTSSLSW